MQRVRKADFLLGVFWTGWRRWAAWSICIGTILLLGVLRKATDAEFAFASLALLPVLVIAWISGRRSGLLASALAAAMWVVGDIAAERHFSAPWIPWTNALIRWMTYTLVALLAAQLRLLFEREHERAILDPLTGLHNRRAFLEAGNFEIGRSKRYAHPLAVVFLDLDNFKCLNDTKGHQAGDAALIATAQGLRSASRSTDLVARLGGDEFAVLLPEIEYGAAVETGRKISVAVDSALQDFLPTRASIGVAWFGQVDRTFPAMLTAADELMYEAKRRAHPAFTSRR